MSWQPLADSYYLHGKLRGYTLSYERLDGLLFPLQVSVDGSDLSLELTDLDEYVEYRIEVRAFTIKGSGPYTHITCLTDEDGKKLANWYFLYFTFYLRIFHPMTKSITKWLMLATRDYV